MNLKKNSNYCSHLCFYGPKINNMFLRHCFSENDVGGKAFYFLIFLILLLVITMYLSNFPQFLTLGLICTATSGCTRNQPKTNKIAATGSQIKLTIDNV